MAMLDIHLVAAARPTFMKVAPLYHALGRCDWARVAADIEARYVKA